MKKQMKKFAVILAIFTVGIFGTSGVKRVLAEDSKTNYDAQIKAAQDKADGIQAALNTTLESVNQVYQKAYASKQAVSTGQAKITKITADIAAAKKEMQERKTVMGQQMRDIQVDNVQSDFVSLIISSKNFSEVITRVASLTTYRKMQNEKVTALAKTETDLATLKMQLETEQTQLKANQEKYETQYADLQSQMATLKTQIADNQAQITALSNSKAAEAKRQADEAARAAAEATPEPKAEPVSKTADVPLAETSNTGTADNTSNAPTTSGKSMTVSTTGYSSDGADGMTPGHVTATGIDLWVNPMCVAVDPSVIPLGSMVEVPGYGIAIAGDTGGAIKGYKVDLHFKTTKEAIVWGRRSVTINVLG
ncbi:3D domain-containing protein [Lactococcus insecticola]|uniref:Uncharacterized protein n=1 Tax=Pseudolactococcus insecticola TaxID=2709158 RepID=A0A6A0B6F5_9LACT|nr:3D domain-containing protein [Lactococcus insecticola]GFH40940.1 hypothetical protein Hs20B_13380 [Lactococcus insecticola]